MARFGDWQPQRWCFRFTQARKDRAKTTDLINMHVTLEINYGKQARGEEMDRSNFDWARLCLEQGEIEVGAQKGVWNTWGRDGGKFRAI